MNAAPQAYRVRAGHIEVRALLILVFCLLTPAVTAGPKARTVLPVEKFEDRVRSELDLGRWQILMIQKDFIVSLDTTTVKQVGPGVHQAWERWDSNVPRKDRLSYSIHKVNVDCAQKRYKYTSMVAYDAKQNIVKTWSARSESEALWQDMVPGSVSEAKYGLVCDLFPSFEINKRPVLLRPLR